MLTLLANDGPAVAERTVGVSGGRRSSRLGRTGDKRRESCHLSHGRISFSSSISPFPCAAQQRPIRGSRGTVAAHLVFGGSHGICIIQTHGSARCKLALRCDSALFWIGQFTGLLHNHSIRSRPLSFSDQPSMHAPYPIPPSHKPAPAPAPRHSLRPRTGTTTSPPPQRCFVSCSSSWP